MTSLPLRVFGLLALSFHLQPLRPTVAEKVFIKTPFQNNGSCLRSVGVITLFSCIEGATFLLYFPQALDKQSFSGFL